MSAPHRKSPVRGGPRHGFTLVEILVVIVVIGILVALLLPAVNAVRNSAFEMAVSTDMTQMDAAIEEFKTDYGVYPTDFSEFLDPTNSNLPYEYGDIIPPLGITVEARLKQILTKISPTHNEDAVEPLEATAMSPRSRLHYWWDNVGKNLAYNVGAIDMSIDDRFHRTRGPEVALWFWLTQVHKSAQFPLSGERYYGDGTASDPDNLLQTVSERHVRYEFAPAALEALDVDGNVATPALDAFSYPNSAGDGAYVIYRPLQKGGDAPFVYFHHSTYAWAGVDFDYRLPAERSAPGDSENFAAAMIVRPDPDGDFTTPPGFYNPTKFQIVTAGVSESFGNFNLDTDPSPGNTDDIERPNGEYNECVDNITNFAEGRIDAFMFEVETVTNN